MRSQSGILNVHMVKSWHTSNERPTNSPQIVGTVVIRSVWCVGSDSGLVTHGGALEQIFSRMCHPNFQEIRVPNTNFSKKYT